MNLGAVCGSTIRVRAGAVLGLALALAAGCEGATELPAADPPQSGALPSELRVVGPGGPVDPPPRKPPVLPPSVSDLRADGVMRFYGGAPGTIGVQINVTNVGNAAAYGPAGQTLIAGLQVSSALFQYYGGTATTANTVNPGERGYIKVDLPAGTLTPCNQFLVHIDVTHTMQAGTPDPFANDQATIATQCLQWTTAITTDNFAISDPLIEGKSLLRIVSSMDVGRRDGLLCSHCHYDGSGLPYSPPVARDTSATIWPDQVIAGRTWQGPGGWAQAFLALPTDDPSQVRSKPFYLQQLVQTWLDDGQEKGQMLVATPLSGVFVLQ